MRAPIHPVLLLLLVLSPLYLCPSPLLLLLLLVLSPVWLLGEELGAHVVRCAHQGLVVFLAALTECRQTKVADLEVTLQCGRGGTEVRKGSGGSRGGTEVGGRTGCRGRSHVPLPRL